MRLINIKTFLEREQMIENGKQVDRRTKVLEFRDDEATEYAVLSHRWIDPTEVDYEEMVNLAKMSVEERNEIRQRLGYKKILDTCVQARKDGYEWVWVDTCCIDKRSSAELSEAINSMYRWYANSRVCYVYLHDVHDSFPTRMDGKEYPKSDGWPEWFSRGWTLQEMIAPGNVQFFNMNWMCLGDKEMLAHTLTRITGVPDHILKKGLAGNRPCVAQILSWASPRRTSRVEDRAYSLMGLLDVNIPMLYGEGKKAFHRLQLEIIRTSNDQSIFAWTSNPFGVRTSNILADDPSFFQNCSGIELMDHGEFIQFLRNKIPEEELSSIDPDSFGVFPTTNRGIHIWMLLSPYPGSNSFFRAYLPCRGPSQQVVTIELVLWKCNYYRCLGMSGRALRVLRKVSQFRQVYLRYQDIPSCNVTFEIDDSGVTENGFTEATATKDTATLTLTANRHHIRVYFERRGSGRFAVIFGQCFGQDWIRLVNNPPKQFLPSDIGDLMFMELDHMSDMPCRGDWRGRVWVHHLCLPGSAWIVRTRRVVWERLRTGIQIEVFQDSRFRNGLYECKSFDIEVSNSLVVYMVYCYGLQRTNDHTRDRRGLMLRDTPCKPSQTLQVDGVSVTFSLAYQGIQVSTHLLYNTWVSREQLGDYGYFSDCGDFRRCGNLLADAKPLIPEVDTIPRRQEVTTDFPFAVVGNYGLSLPSNHAFNSMLASVSSRLTNAYLVTRIVQCRQCESCIYSSCLVSV